MGPVPRIRQLVLSWESLECTRVNSLKSSHHGYGVARHTPDLTPCSSVSQTKQLNKFSGSQPGVWTPLQWWAAVSCHNLGLTM